MNGVPGPKNRVGTGSKNQVPALKIGLKPVLRTKYLIQFQEPNTRFPRIRKINCVTGHFIFRVVCAKIRLEPVLKTEYLVQKTGSKNRVPSPKIELKPVPRTKYLIRFQEPNTWFPRIDTPIFEYTGP